MPGGVVGGVIGGLPEAPPAPPLKPVRVGGRRGVVLHHRRHLAEKRRLGYDMVVDHDTLETDSDIHAIQIDRVVSVTPLSLDITSRVDLGRLQAQLRG